MKTGPLLELRLDTQENQEEVLGKVTNEPVLLIMSVKADKKRACSAIFVYNNIDKQRAVLLNIKNVCGSQEKESSITEDYLTSPPVGTFNTNYKLIKTKRFISSSPIGKSSFTRKEDERDPLEKWEV